MAHLAARIKTLEDATSAADVPSRLNKITQYGFRREEDFDKYEALAMAEQLSSAAKVSGHEKASTYDVIACTLRERLSVPTKQFKACFVALLADKEYAKVLEAVSKVDKSFKALSSPASGSAPQPSARTGPRRTRVYCYAWGEPGHITTNCYRRLAGRNPPPRGARPLMPTPNE